MLVLFSSSFFVEAANAVTLSETALFRRCYSQLTGHPVPRQHDGMAQVKDGKITALQACQALLDKTQLNPQSGLLVDSKDPEPAWILRKFYEFHRNWFPANAVEAIQGYNDETASSTRDLYDATEPSLALTRAMFSQGAKYSEVLTLGTGVEALRVEDAALRQRLGWSVSFPGRSVYGNNVLLDQVLVNFAGLGGGFSGDSEQTKSFFLNPPRIQTGELIGIRPRALGFVVPNFELTPLGPQGPTVGQLQPGLNSTFDLYQTQGGGVLGTPIYLMMNLGHGYNTKMDGHLKLARRWSQVNMETFLCAKLPVLRSTDVQAFVEPQAPTPFRQAASCVACHATLDPMAYTARNVITGTSDYSTFSAGSKLHSRLTALVSTYRSEFGSVAGWPSGPAGFNPAQPFHRQSPTGRLYFRSFSGALIDRSVPNIAGLGQALSETDDYYQCAAKRYFEHLTGIEVALYDRQDPRYVELNRSLSAESRADREFIEELARQLKSHQSIKQLIKSILGSPYYRSANFRPGGTP